MRACVAECARADGVYVTVRTRGVCARVCSCMCTMCAGLCMLCVCARVCVSLCDRVRACGVT